MNTLYTVAVIAILAVAGFVVVNQDQPQQSVTVGGMTIPAKQMSLAIANPGTIDDKKIEIKASTTQRLANYLITIRDPKTQEAVYTGYLHDLVNLYNQAVADIVLLRAQGRDTSALEAKAILYQTYQADVIADFQAQGLEDFATSTPI